MPLPKRLVEPVHVARGTIPEDFPLPSELEAATNGTLANAVRQLSSLSKHAEDLFGELARDAQVLACRANSLQARIDRLAIKVTQLDSNVEEVSLQDIHMRKAFKSSVVFDQQVVSRDTMPTAMLDTYRHCDKPPPLDKLNSYRDDGKDGLKFYTDPGYFFDLWRQEMLKDTERMMHDKGKRPHRPRNEGGGGRHKKRVRQPHNTRERQRQIVVGQGEYIMPQPQPSHYRTPQVQQNYHQMMPDEALMMMGDGRPPRPNSIELRRSYPQEQVDSVYSPHPHPGAHNPPDIYRENYIMGNEENVCGQYTGGISSHYAPGSIQEYTSPTGTPSRGSRATSQRPSVPPPAPPSNTNSQTSTPTISSTTNTPTRGRSMSTGRETLPPPPPPPVDTPTTSPPIQTTSPRTSLTPEPLPPPPPLPDLPPPPCNIPPPPPPPPPMPVPNGPTSPSPLINGDIGKSPVKQIISMSPPSKVSTSPPKPVGDVNMNSTAIRPKGVTAPPQYDPRCDLLKAIRDGIKLRKVEKNEQKEGERTNALHDVASILARRVAVEFSDSDSASESEYDSEGWGEQETSA
ncbi:actin-binding protein WASF3 isoform X2 [Macrosteles quadrilineatus]|uniref:actin-binding protein WASF3 isoform X2 n=1 Tax=Macrosteles quadrilineatus TaxID=74068 RepID=UPI0023E33566|nr:actin-binding protein WASF3 isoform X2 [Macrosteles quadrilineatus]